MSHPSERAQRRSVNCSVVVIAPMMITRLPTMGQELVGGLGGGGEQLVDPRLPSAALDLATHQRKAPVAAQPQLAAVDGQGAGAATRRPAAAAQVGRRAARPERAVALLVRVVQAAAKGFCLLEPHLKLVLVDGDGLGWS